MGSDQQRAVGSVRRGGVGASGRVPPGRRDQPAGHHPSVAGLPAPRPESQRSGNKLTKIKRKKREKNETKPDGGRCFRCRPHRQRRQRPGPRDRTPAGAVLHRQVRRRGLQRLPPQRDAPLGRRRGRRRARGLHHR